MEPTQLLLCLERTSKSLPSFAKNAKEGWGTLAIFICFGRLATRWRDDSVHP